MESNKTRLRPADISIIGTLLVLPGFIAVFLFVLFYFGIDRSEVVEEPASVRGQATLSEQAAVIATLNAVPARTAIPRDITSGASQTVVNEMGYTESMINNGQRDFLAVCSACHGTDGRGISGVGKPLINSEFIRGRSDQELLDFIIQGRQPWDADNTTGVAMPARGGQGMTDQVLINIIAYVRVLDGHVPEDKTAASASDGSSASAVASTTDQTDSPPIDENHDPIVAIDLVAGGSDSDSEDVAEEDPGRDGEALYTALCEADDASQAMCDFLVEQIAGGADEARITDLLTNGSSPFDTSIPAGIFVPQRGGQLFLSDPEIRTLTVHLFGLAGIELAVDIDTSDSASSDRDGEALYTALCEVDDTSQAMCDFLVGLINDGAEHNRITDLLTNGSSPFDTSIPSDIFIPQRGGSLLFSDAEVQNLVDHLYTLSNGEASSDEADGEETGRIPQQVNPTEDTIQTVAYTQPDGSTLYDGLCEYNAPYQAMCDYLVSLIIDGASLDRIEFLLTNGSSVTDQTIPEDIFIPKRGGHLILNDAEIQTLAAYLFSLADVELPERVATTPTGSLYTTDSLSRLSYVNQLQGSVISPPRDLEDFTLPSTTGQDFTLSENGGKIIMVYFGYLTCPDVCPATLADMRRAYLEIGAPHEDVVVLFITLDPERDTLERMGSYVNAFHIDFIGLRPTSPEQLEALKANFGVFSETREVDSGAGYLIDHSAAVLLITPDGRIVSQLPFGVSYREITNDLNVLMNYTLSPSEVAIDAAARIPVDDPAREYRIVIPEGTSTQIAMGNDPGIIPLTINLTIGERDVLVLENHDNADFLVGGVWVAPYETVRKQFYEPQTFVGLCTVTVGRDLVEIVVVEPD